MSSHLSVTSEIYDEQSVKGSVISLDLQNVEKLFQLHDSAVSYDEDGDILINRPKPIKIVLEVETNTLLDRVGLQLWRGAFVLADLMLHHLHEYLEGKVILDLGAGVGLTSITSAMFAHRVISTDISEGGILNRIRKNISLNSTLIKSNISVLPLNFLDLNWSSELEEAIKSAQIILAADVIYDNTITEAFADTLAKILSLSSKVALIALEKRYVFTVDDLDTVAPCYEHFLNYLKSTWNKPPMSSWSVQLVPLDFPQYFQYQRNRHLVVWKIESN